MKNNTKRVLTFIIGTTAAFTIGYTMNPSVKKNKTVIDSELVTIEYSEVAEKFGSGGYDILITPKNGTNVSPIFSMDETKNYRDAYIIGHSKEAARKHVELANEKYNLNWAFSWGN